MKKIDRGYCNKIKPLIRRIAYYASNTNLVRPDTANHLIEYLQGSVTFDPKISLTLALEIVKGSKVHGYHLDSLGVKNAVGLVEILLADHKDLLREDKCMNEMLEFLDIFAEAGWNEAAKLVWRLEEIFR